MVRVESQGLKDRVPDKESRKAGNLIYEFKG
jgi:hypothetical protein